MAGVCKNGARGKDGVDTEEQGASVGGAAACLLPCALDVWGSTRAECMVLAYCSCISGMICVEQIPTAVMYRLLRLL